MRRRNVTRKNNERGAALVEMAMVLPLLVLLVFGIVEYGLLFKERLTIASAASSAARTGATMGTRDEADMAILRALEAGLFDQVDTGVLIRVDIFKADPVTGATIGNTFDRYIYDDSDPTCKWNPCPDGAGAGYAWGIPSGYPPPGRGVTLDPGGGGLDILGIEIVYHHTAVTNIIPGVDRNLTERALVRLEPNVFGSGP